MALDGIVTRSIVHELQICVGGRINKIHQPTDNDIIIQLRSRGGNRRLLLSANPTYPRVQMTEQSFPNPLEAPMFCMLLRKYCESGVIEAVTQQEMERIIHIDIRQRDELGDESLKRIIIELMGRHSNIILLDPASGTQLDGIHHVTPAISSYRIVLPGFAYTEPPQQNKLHPLEIVKEQFMDAYQQAEIGTSDKSWLVSTFSGLSPLIAEEICLRASKAEEDSAGVAADNNASHEMTMGKATTLWSPFADLMAQIREHRYEPVTGENAKGKSVFSAVKLTLIQSDLRTYDSISDCMEEYYGDKALRDTVKQKTSDLLRFLHNELSKNIKKMSKLEEDLAEAGDAEQYRVRGELLFASLHLMHKGDKAVELINYYDENQATETIELDPLLTPSENAQRYFKKYNTYKNSLTVIDEQMKITREEISYMEQLLQQLSHATLDDIDEIREELVQQGYLRDRSKKMKKKKKNDKPTLHVYTSSEGIEIYVGKNNLQNDYVTNRVGNANDTWLHTKDIPGSHVLIRSNSYGEATLNEAAQLSAYYSQAKQSSSVPVDYTLIRHVRKPSGAKPGFVIYDHQKTLFVTPDEHMIKKMPNVVRN